jgi:hypothetical protein
MDLNQQSRKPKLKYIQVEVNSNSLIYPFINKIDEIKKNIPQEIFNSKG